MDRNVDRTVESDRNRRLPAFMPYGTPCDELIDPLVRNVEALRAELLALEAQVARLQSSPRMGQMQPCGGDQSAP